MPERWVHIGWTTTNVPWDQMQRGSLRCVRFQWRPRVRPGFYLCYAHFGDLESVLHFVTHAIGKHHELEIKAFASSVRCHEEWLMQRERELWCLLQRPIAPAALPL